MMILSLFFNPKRVNRRECAANPNNGGEGALTKQRVFPLTQQIKTIVLSCGKHISRRG
jgi:hypothetical protein